MAENDNPSADAPGADVTGADGGSTATAAAPQTESAAPPADGDATPEETAAAPAAPPEEITYHAVEKDGQVTAIWEMQGRKHLRTIDPRSRQGQEILRLYTAEHHEEHGAQQQ